VKTTVAVAAFALDSAERCWDCGHAIEDHSRSYPMEHLRGVPERDRPAKRPDEGCLVAGCRCRRWFQQVACEAVRDRGSDSSSSATEV
jgi:hypothetical protein